MNTNTTRTLVRTIGLAGLSVPLAMGLALGAAGAAHADEGFIFVPANPDPIGPGDIAVADDDDECDLHDICLPEEEDPKPNPDLPQGPGDITLPEEDPEGPGDIANPEEDDDPEVPEGPGDLTDTPDCTHGCGDGGEGEDDKGTTGGFDTPERIDAGEAGEAGFDFGWVLPSGLVVVAAGAAYAARRRLA